MIIVLDTNVLVSGLLNGNGNPGRIIDQLLQGRFRIAYDDRILGEYEDVLARPELNIRPSRAKAVIGYIELSGVYVEAEALSDDDFPDRDDKMFAEVFITCQADALVTGNLRHFSFLIDKGFPVLTQTQFVERFFSEVIT